MLPGIVIEPLTGHIIRDDVALFDGSRFVGHSPGRIWKWTVSLASREGLGMVDGTHSPLPKVWLA